MLFGNIFFDSYINEWNIIVTVSGFVNSVQPFEVVADGHVELTIIYIIT